MTLSEKSAYLKGLMEGMKLDTETNEGKLISEIISMLQDVAENVSDLEEVVDCISDELDCIEEDLDNIDDYLMDDDDDEYDDYDEDEDYEDDEDDDDQNEYDFGSETLYEVKCRSHHHRRGNARRGRDDLPELRRRAGVRHGRRGLRRGRVIKIQKTPPGWAAFFPVGSILHTMPAAYSAHWLYNPRIHAATSIP